MIRWLALPLFVFTTTAAHAQVDDEARTRARRGIELFDEGNFRLALVELERAYELRPSAKILYNIGQVHLQLGSYAAAQKAFRRYLEGDDVAPERRAEVERDLAMIGTRIATLTVDTLADADVTIDDQPVGHAPLRTMVDAGVVRVAVSKSGYETQARTLKLAGGDVTTVKIELAPLRREVIVAPTEGLSTVALGGWITTGVLALGAIGTGIAASAAASKFDTMRDTPISGSPERAAADLDSQAALADGLALTTDLLVVASIIAGGVSLYLTLRGKPKPGMPAAVVRW